MRLGADQRELANPARTNGGEFTAATANSTAVHGLMPVDSDSMSLMNVQETLRPSPERINRLSTDAKQSN